MKIEIVNIDLLKVHPFLQQLPEPSSNIMTTMAADILDRGIQEPLIVDEKNRVMNGRVRLKVAIQIELTELPVTRRPSSEAATIIVQSLLQRQHFSKSALAYICFPFFQSMVEESRRRRVANLKRGPDSTQNGLSGKTAEDVARQAGVSRALFFQAAEVHKLFKKHPEAKEILEPQILSGDLSLGYAINGVAGQVSTKGTTRGEADQLDLFRRGIYALRVRFERWDLLAQKHRLLVSNEFAETIANAPEEVQQRVLATLNNRKAAAR